MTLTVNTYARRLNIGRVEYNVTVGRRFNRHADVRRFYVY